MNKQLLTLKEQQEQAAFVRFTERLRTTTEWKSISSRKPPEPDLRCEHHKEGVVVAFELLSLTNPDIAEIQSIGNKAKKTVFYTKQPEHQTIWKKLRASESYQTDASRIELLIYTDGRAIMPDDDLIVMVREALGGSSAMHHFARIWFMGESKTCPVYPEL